MPQKYDNPKDAPKVEEAFKPSGEDASVQQYTNPAPEPDIKHRISTFDPPSLAFAPDMAGHVITRLPVPDQQASWIGELMADAVPYLQKFHEFAGVPGQLLRARQAANQIPDVYQRQRALHFLDELQKLDPQMQADLLLYFQGYRRDRMGAPRSPLTRSDPRDAALGAAAEQVFLGAGFEGAYEQTSTGYAHGKQISYDDATGNLTYAADAETITRVDPDTGQIVQTATEDPDVEVLEQIAKMFPGLDLQGIHPSVLAEVGADAGDWLLEHEGVKAALRTLDDVATEANSPDYSVAKLGRDILRVGGAYAGAAGDVGFDVAGNVGRKVPFVGQAVTDFAGRQARAAENQISKAVEASGLMTAGMKPIGKDPITGQPVFSLEDQRAIEARTGAFIFLAGLAGGAAGSLVGKAGRRLKVVGTAAGKPVAAAALEASRSIRRGGPLGTAAEVYRLPVREITKLIDKGLVAFAKDPEKFFSQGIRTGKQGRRLIQALNEARKVHPGTGEEALNGQVGFIRQAYGEQLNERLVRKMLEQPTDEGAKRVFIDTLMNSHAGREAINDLNKQQVKVRQRLAELEAATPEIPGSKPKRLVVDNSFVELAGYTEEGYHYHVTRPGNIKNIQRIGLELKRPPKGSWEDGSTDARVYFGKDVATSSAMANIVGRGTAQAKDMVLLRIADDALPPLVEKVGFPEAEVATNQPIKPGQLQYLSEDGIWRPIEELGAVGGRLERKARAMARVKTLAQEVDRSPEITDDLRARAKAALDEYDGVVAEEREVSRLRLQETDLDWRLKTTFDDDPMFKYPKQNVIRAAVRHAPINRVSRLLHAAFLPGRKAGLDPFKTVDELAHHPEVPILGSINAPPNALKEATNTISNYLQRLVPPRVLEQRLGELAQVKSRSEFFDLLEHKIFGKGGDIDTHLPKNFDPVLRQRLINLHDTPIEARTRSQLTTQNADGSVSYKPVLGKGEIPFPSRDTEFLGSLRLPDVNLIIEADSMLRRGLSKLERSGKLGATAYQAGWRLPTFILHVATLIGKPAVMLPRLLGAMPMRIQLEQVARMTGFGYKAPFGRPRGIVVFPGGIPVPFTHGVKVARSMFGENGWKLLDPDPRYTGLEAPTESALGMFMGEMSDDAPMVRTRESTLDFRTGRRAPKLEHWESFRSTLEEAHASRVDSKLAQLGLDEKAFIRWLESDNWAKRYMATEQMPELVKAGVDVKTWVRARIEYLKQLTKEDPKYLHTIATGKSQVRSRLGGDFDVTGRSVKALYDAEIEKLDLLGTTIREKLAEGADQTEIAALQNERLIATRAIEEMQRETPSLLDGVKAIKLSDKKRWRNHVKKEWEAGRMELPDTLFVEKRLRASQHDGGWLDDAEVYASGISNLMYRRFKVLSWADRHGTRGSLYDQAFARQKLQFVRRGFSEKAADALAQARASEITKDLMYDLTARTSLQRALKDTFWFAPAYQEVLYTWLVKMPSEAYWPIGATSIALKGAGLIDMLSAAGVIREDSRGEKVILVPGLDTLIEKLTGQKVPAIVSGRLTGLNLVGAGMPGLSIPANFVLGEAALRRGGIFKDISDLFQPYGPDTALLPQPVTMVWEALMGSPPPLLSPERTKADWDKSFDIGIQYAYAELNQAGRTPPRFEDYGKKVKGIWSLTPAQAATYEKDKAAYLHELFDLSKRYQQGIAWVRAIGSTVAPMSLSATSKEREEWDNFWTKIIEPEFPEDARSGFSDRQRDLIDSYVEDHPNSLAFATFYRGQGEKVRELPFPEELDDAFYDASYTGEKLVLTPADFTKKLMASESRRYYQAQLDNELNAISASRDPWILLTHGFEKKTAMANHRKNWGQYLQLNPEVGALLDEQSAQWKKNNDFPVQSYSAERTADLYNILWEMSPMLTGEEGIRPDYLRRTLTEAAILYSDQGDFGEPRTPEQKAIGWYMTNVYVPRIQEAVPLYEEAERLQNQGLPAGQVYNQIRDIYNRKTPKYKGQQTPSVEAVFFGNRNNAEQKAAILAWQSRPVSWLTDFQLDKAGYGLGSKARDFLSQVSEYDTAMWDDINKRGVSPSSKEYDQIKAERIRFLGARARELGPDVVDIWNLNEAPPVFRLNSQGFGSGNAEWKNVSSAAKTIIDKIEAADFSIKGFSETATQYKKFFYAGLAHSREDNPALDRLFVKLSHSFPMPKGGYREGAVLYEAVFFGNFNEKYIPYDVAQAAQQAA